MEGGELQAESEEIEHLGIRGHIRKPLSKRTMRVELAALREHGNDKRRVQPTAPNDYHIFSHLNVLVAEDNAVNQMVIRGLLGKMNIEPTLVENGIEALAEVEQNPDAYEDRKSTRLNSSHVAISYAVFCLKKQSAPR